MPLVPQEEFGPKDNDLLLNVAGTYSFIENDFADTTSISAQVGLGYFLTREHEVGGQLLTVWSDVDDGPSSTAIFIGPYYNYNYYLDTRTTLYGGPHVGLFHIEADTGANDESANEFSYGLHVGFRRWLTPSVSFNVEPRWTHSNFDDDLGGDSDQYDVLFGFSVVL